ncbi:MAG: OsmC family protein [Candidatus Hadarchaeia archaeon]
MRVLVRNIEGLNFEGKADSNHWVSMDGPSDLGGFEAASKPMELILIALGGCTGMDVVSLMEKMRVEYEDLDIEISASREEEHPKVFSEIEILYKVWGDVDEEKVKRAIDKSQNKYCSVSAMLRNTAEVSYSYEINPDR